MKNRFIFSFLIIVCTLIIITEHNSFASKLITRQLRDAPTVDTLVFDLYKSTTTLKEIHWAKDLQDSMDHKMIIIYDSTIQQVSTTLYTYNVNDDWEDFLFCIQYKNNDTISQSSELILFSHPYFANLDTIWIYPDRITSNQSNIPMFYYNLGVLPYKNNTKSFVKFDQSVEYYFPVPLISSVNESQILKTSIAVNPNPIRSNAIVTFYSPPSGELKFVIYDLIGNIVYESIFNSNSDKYIQSINSDLIVNGIYYGVLFKENKLIAKHPIIISK